MATPDSLDQFAHDFGAHVEKCSICLKALEHAGGKVLDKATLKSVKSIETPIRVCPQY
jgi:hypothetical protein